MAQWLAKPAEKCEPTKDLRELLQSPSSDVRTVLSRISNGEDPRGELIPLVAK